MKDYSQDFQMRGPISNEEIQIKIVPDSPKLKSETFSDDLFSFEEVKEEDDEDAEQEIQEIE